MSKPDIQAIVDTVAEFEIRLKELKAELKRRDLVDKRLGGSWQYEHDEKVSVVKKCKAHILTTEADRDRLREVLKWTADECIQGQNRLHGIKYSKPGKDTFKDIEKYIRKKLIESKGGEE